MSESSALIDELRRIRGYLLTPTHRSMLQCEQDAARVRANVENTALDPRSAGEVKRLAGEVGKLLGSARAFWDGRRQVGNPGQQYGSNGSTILPVADCSFAVEV